MDAEQVTRWKDMARRLCYHAWPEKTNERKARLWKEALYFIEEHAGYDLRGWCESGGDDPYACDLFDDAFWDDYGRSIDRDEDINTDPRYFFNQLRCVIRASLNALFGDEGILGFTVGDLRRMFDGAIPDWISQQYEHPETLLQADDAAPVWL
jgi:hypothetical protein